MGLPHHQYMLLSPSGIGWKTTGIDSLRNCFSTSATASMSCTNAIVASEISPLSRSAYSSSASDMHISRSHTASLSIKSEVSA